VVQPSLDGDAVRQQNRNVIVHEPGEAPAIVLAFDNDDPVRLRGVAG
jgi:hypothetical protein